MESKQNTRLCFDLGCLLDSSNARLASPGSLAYLRPGDVPSRRVIVFIHSLSSAPLFTWGDFPKELASNPGYRDADFVFYGFPNPRRSIFSLANLLDYLLGRIYDGSLLCEFLSSLSDISGSGQTLNPSTRPAPSVHREIIIVAHSLAAVAVRKAVLYAAGTDKSWVARAQLVLFAPAHCGARLAVTGHDFLQTIPVFSALQPLLAHLFPASTELNPEKSTLLRPLREDTEELASKRTGEFPDPFRAHCAFGADDSVVYPDHFKYDLRLLPDVAGRDHFNICRVTSRWNWPARYLRESIHRLQQEEMNTMVLPHDD